MRSRCSLFVCLCIPSIVARQRLGKSPFIVARQRLGKNPLIGARQRLGKSPLIVARQRLGRNVTAVTNTHAIIEELLDASFSMWPCRIKESRRLVLPRTSCINIDFEIRIQTNQLHNYIPKRKSQPSTCLIVAKRTELRKKQAEDMARILSQVIRIS
jgi:hypothetical protein